MEEEVVVQRIKKGLESSAFLTDFTGKHPLIIEVYASCVGVGCVDPGSKWSGKTCLFC